uniref:Importin-11 n=1 Tax=Elaeophora elaphi TaxID=1147741 RepID=A0A0R3RW59_9BILA
MMTEKGKKEIIEKSEKVSADSESFSPLLQQIDDVVIQNLEYPWKGTEDRKPTDLEYELFCGALESFCSKPLTELVQITEKVQEMDVELARWVEFGLNSSHSTSYAGSSQMVMIGCSLTKQLSAMHEKDLGVKFCAPKYLHYVMDIISSKHYCSSIRCEAAKALLDILFHPSTSWKFMVMEIEGNKYTPYEQVVHLFMKSQDVPLDLLTVLQKIASYFAFKYNTDIIINYAQRFFMEEDCDIHVDTPQLFSSFSILNNFFSKIRNDFSYMSCAAYRAVVSGCLIPHICAHATSSRQDARIRYLAVRCLRLLCDFDGTDITGAVFLSQMSTRTISLVGRLLQQISVVLEDSKETSLLPYALRAIVLIDLLAAGNEKCISVIDAPERITVLQNMLHMLLVEEGRLAIISALSFGDNLKHLLNVCDLQKSVLTLEGHTDDDIKMRFRQTATYGYLCEILFALARNQSSGKFWRNHGPEINKLIDCNLISAATSLKQWLEPFREELVLGKNINTLNFLLVRLTHHSEKYVEGDPPLALVTLLRLIDALLDEAENATLCDVSPDEISFDYYARFYQDGGLGKITDVLGVANAQQSKRVHYRCTSLTGDSYIYCQFVRSATNIIYKLLSSLQSINQSPDKLIVDTLLRTYTLCCMDEASGDRIVREIIINSFALFIFPTLPDRQGLRRTGRQSFLELFLNSGFDKPPNFFAALDILLQLFPLPSDLLTNIVGINMQEVTAMKKLWSSRILENGKQLQFAIMLGISSSQRLKRRLLDLFKRLAYSSENNALRLIDILIKQSLRILASSAHKAVADAFDDDIVEEESNVRFGNAVDHVTTSFYAFLAICSGELVLRNAMVIIISQRKSYIPTLLKFFKLASPKTLPHVSFQAHVIKIFRNLCVADNNNVDGKIDCLPRDIYIRICDSLVEHFGNMEHNIETTVLALESICNIGHSSAFGCAVVSNAVISHEGALLHFMDRFLVGEPIGKLLFEMANHLIDLFENILKRDSVKFVVLKLQSSTDSEEHPLARLKNQLARSECSQDVLLSFQKVLDASTRAEPIQAAPENLETYEWPENLTTVQQVDSQQITNYDVKDLLSSDNGDFQIGATLSTVDLNMLSEEFFPESRLLSAKKSTPPVQPQSMNSVSFQSYTRFFLIRLGGSGFPSLRKLLKDYF